MDQAEEVFAGPAKFPTARFLAIFAPADKVPASLVICGLS